MYFKSASLKTLTKMQILQYILISYWLKRILRAAKAVMKEFSKAAYSHMNRLLKTAAQNISNATKNCLLYRLSAIH